MLRTSFSGNSNPCHACGHNVSEEIEPIAELNINHLKDKRAHQTAVKMECDCIFHRFCLNNHFEFLKKNHQELKCQRCNKKVTILSDKNCLKKTSDLNLIPISKEIQQENDEDEIFNTRLVYSVALPLFILYFSQK